MKRFWNKFKRHRLGQLGLFVLLALVVITIFAPVITRHGPLENNYAAVYSSPNRDYWLGTDDLGRSIFARLIFGGRVSLFLGLLISSVRTLVAVVMGLISTLSGKSGEFIMQRLVEIQMSIPELIGAMIISSFLGRGILGAIIGLTFWRAADGGRLVRSEVLQLKEESFIEAANSLGASSWRIIFRHILPNIVPTIIVFFTINVAFSILSLATLSFLGYGVNPPTPSWGVLLQSAKELSVLKNRPWIWIPPGLAISLSVLSINFIGDALRDALDPNYYKKNV